MTVSKLTDSSIKGATKYNSLSAGNLFTAVPVGAYESIATFTPSGSTGTVTFSSIPQNYTHLQLRIQARGTSGAGGYYTSVAVNLNGDTTAGNYYYHIIGGNGANAVSPSPGSGYSQNGLINIPNALNTSNVFAGAIIDIPDYSSYVKNKTLRSLNGADLNNTSGFPYSGAIFLSSMLWKNTAPITSITFTADATYSTNFANGSSFALYGVKA
jgi:hypothetical protein